MGPDKVRGPRYDTVLAMVFSYRRGLVDGDLHTLMVSVSYHPCLLEGRKHISLSLCYDNSSQDSSFAAS